MHFHSRQTWNQASDITSKENWDRYELSAIWHAFRQKYGAAYTVPFSQFRIAAVPANV